MEILNEIEILENMEMSVKNRNVSQTRNFGQTGKLKKIWKFQRNSS